MATRSEFAASIKAKYPAYKDVEDSVLVDKMLEKYPQYRDRVTDAPQAEVQPAETPVPAAPAADLTDRPYMNPAVNLGLKGIRKGMEFAENLGTSWATGPFNAVAQAIQDKGASPMVVPTAIGNVAKTIADPFVPGPNWIQSTERSLERAGVDNQPRPSVLKLPNFLDGGVIEMPYTTPGLAKEMGAVTDAVAPAATGLAAVKAAGAAARMALNIKPAKAVTEAIGAGLEGVGKTQMHKVIKPLMRHERKARKPIEQVVFEQGFDQGKGGAAPKEIYDRSTAKLNELGAKLKAEIKAGRDAGARINTDEIIDGVVAELKANPGESEDFFTMVNDLDEVAKDFKSRAQAANGTGSLDLLQGHAFKKYMGHEGAWQGIAQSKGIPLTAKETSRSKIAEKIYHRLNDAIDDAAPNGIKDLNRQISEVIPVNQAAGWRQIVEGRGNALSLSDVIGMTATAINPKIWPILAVNRATKSGTVASKIYRLGEWMKSGNPSPKAKSLWGSLQKPLKETQKARIIQLLEAELEAQGPANTIPFQPKKVAEESEDDSTLSLRTP